MTFFTECNGELKFKFLQGFYEQLKPLASFGPEFQRLRCLRGNENEALAEVATFTKDSGSVFLISVVLLFIEQNRKGYCFNPIALDACLHYALHPVVLQNLEEGATYLPSKMRKFAFYQEFKAGESVYSYFVLRQWTPGKWNHY
jgi:Polyketide synthase dehydratase